MNHIGILKLIVIALFVAFFATSTLSCAKKTVFNTSSVIPAARGAVAVKKDKNENYKITLNLSYLAEPDRLDPPKKTYVVWQISDDNETINLGQIISTSKLHVAFETVSSSKPKVIFITAEEDANVQYPGNTRVLETDKF